MKKNILVFTGSARTGGNTDLLADAFITGATNAGHDVVKCEVGKKNIKGCIDCKTCFSKGKPCSHDDDFNNIAPYIEKADMIVFSTPLYWYTFSAQIKAALDKLYSFTIGKKKLNITESMLLVCGEENNEAAYKGIIRTYELIISYKKWTDRGQLVVPGVLNKGDILSTNYLVRAEKMGSEL